MWFLWGPGLLGMRFGRTLNSQANYIWINFSLALFFRLIVNFFLSGELHRSVDSDGNGVNETLSKKIKLILIGVESWVSICLTEKWRQIEMRIFGRGRYRIRFATESHTTPNDSTIFRELVVVWCQLREWWIQFRNIKLWLVSRRLNSFASFRFNE